MFWQPQFVDGAKSLPKPSSTPVADTPLPLKKEVDKEEEEEVGVLVIVVIVGKHYLLR